MPTFRRWQPEVGVEVVVARGHAAVHQVARLARPAALVEARPRAAHELVVLQPVSENNYINDNGNA